MAVTERSYAAFADRDVSRPGSCGASARALRTAIRKSGTAITALRRAILRARPAPKLRMRTRTAKLNAVAIRYAAACG
jgi:hypothetical protein